MHISSCRRLANCLHVLAYCTLPRVHGFLRGRVLRTRQAPVNLSSSTMTGDAGVHLTLASA
jgi:hypothetical protein